MSAEMLPSSPSPSGASSWLASLRARAVSLERSLQYTPCYIRLSTLDRRLQASLLLLPLVVVVVVAVCLSLPGDQCREGQYRGSLARTERGLACVDWSRLNRSLHTVTPDRFPLADLGQHSYCRNPDSSPRPWCYTSTTANTFDYCPLAPCSPPTTSPSPRLRPQSDWSCDSTVTLLHPALPRGGGVYMATSQWANGRGVYSRAGSPGPGPQLCLSWHGLYRHWWLGPCTHRGQNSGYAWLEEDARCPYQGSVWREAGTDALQAGMLVARQDCMRYGVAHGGVVLDDRIHHGGNGLFTPRTSSPGECQELCQGTLGCVGFTWYQNVNCTLHSSSPAPGTPPPPSSGTELVSGPADCENKVRVGCPAGSELLDSGSCLQFLTSHCPEGCSRWRAMQECQADGGDLADSLALKDLVDLLALAGSKYNTSTWWTGASDFSKLAGKFTWEASRQALSDTPELWVEGGGLAEGGGGEGHTCVYINHQEGGGGGMRLDTAPCQAEVARPLCQYRNS